MHSLETLIAFTELVRDFEVSFSCPLELNSRFRQLLHAVADESEVWKRQLEYYQGKMEGEQLTLLPDPCPACSAQTAGEVIPWQPGQQA